jgi:hypothetical protein
MKREGGNEGLHAAINAVVDSVSSVSGTIDSCMLQIVSMWMPQYDAFLPHFTIQFSVRMMFDKRWKSLDEKAVKGVRNREFPNLGAIIPSHRPRHFLDLRLQRRI